LGLAQFVVTHHDIEKGSKEPLRKGLKGKKKKRDKNEDEYPPQETIGLFFFLVSNARPPPPPPFPTISTRWREVP
jgi:hypothetical protein